MKTLELKSCNLNDPRPLYFLEGIDFIDLSDNDISSLEDVAPFLSTMRYIRELKLSKNPICTLKKYRDHIIMLSSNLVELDGKTITK